MKKLTLILFLLSSLVSNASINVDSLWGVWNNKSIKDTSRFIALDQLIDKYYLDVEINTDTAIILSKLLIKKTTAPKYISHHIAGYQNLAKAYYEVGNNIQLTEFLNKYETLTNKLSDIELKANALLNIANIYLRAGDYTKATNLYYESLNIYEQTKNQKLIGTVYEKIGLLYYYQLDYEKTLEYYHKTLAIYDSLDYVVGKGEIYNSIGRVLKKQNKLDEAISYFEKSLSILKELNDSRSITPLGNLSLIYKKQGNYTKFLEITDMIIEESEKKNDKYNLTTALNSKAYMYHHQMKLPKKALPYSIRAYNLSVKMNSPKKIKGSAGLLYLIYAELGDYKNAYKVFSEYINIRDQLISEDNQKELIHQEYKFDFDKKMLADSIKDAEAKKILDAQIATQNAELKQEKTQKIALYGGVLVLALFGGFVYNRFRLAKKQKTIIEEQKKEVEIAHKELEEVHKEITDSINYAERIQRSFLATEEILNNNLNEHFVFFQPKEAVSGDFYWATKLSNGNFAIVNADSTGHGVPGAIMSILNISSLEKAVEKGLTNPSEIFNDTRKTIIERLKKDGSAEGGKDGMDASIVCYDFINNKIIYTAANNPIWVIRDKKVIQFKPEKMPVGKHDNDETPFTHSEFEIKKGDQVYTLTDGFQDQFGGPKGKKYMVKRMREFVLSVSHLPMEEQHQKIKDEFNNWKQGVEQIDDVCVIGVRI